MKKLLFLIFIICFVACSGGDRVPKGILPRDKMQQVLWDMINAGEFLNNYIYTSDTINKVAENEKIYSEVLRLHEITRKDFEKSYEYYRQHPLMMKSILDSLSKRDVASETAPSTPAPTSPMRDSLRMRKKILQAEEVR